MGIGKIMYHPLIVDPATQQLDSLPGIPSASARETSFSGK